MDKTHQDWNALFSVISQTHKIQTHWDYFVWLQNSVAEFIPHNLMLAVWGDFNQQEDCQLHYDAASNVEGIGTRVITAQSKKTDNIILNLHQRWVANHRRFFVIDHFNKTSMGREIAGLFPGLALASNALLVHGVIDTRSETECLYLFFYQADHIEAKPHLINLIIPHVDHALRKITLLTQIEKTDRPVLSTGIYGLSDREIEVVSWIKAGKTNQEIGMILNISQNTVKSHLKRIFQKLNVGRRAQAVALLLNPDFPSGDFTST